MIKIKQEIIDQLFAHARKDLPIEACGYLAEKDGVVCQHFEMTNTDQSPEHFSLDPNEQFAVFEKTREMGLKIRGVYHSHPSTPARPSQEDIKLAFDPSVSYVIMSLIDPEIAIKSFRIEDGEVDPEPIEII